MTNRADGPAYACLSALNEASTIGPVLRELLRCPDLDGVVLLVNGSTDATAGEARRVAAEHHDRDHPSIHIHELAEPLGHDVGRSLTGQLALEQGAEVLLFLDADFRVRARDLCHFVRAVRCGADVALNRLSGLASMWGAFGPVSAAQRALNALVNRPDLGLDSLVAVPHALSRRAVEVVGCESLSVPPLAQVRAILAGLSVVSPHVVDITAVNRPTPGRPRSRSPKEMRELILGDHLEAAAEVIRTRGPRGGFPDHGRRRSHTLREARQE